MRGLLAQSHAQSTLQKGSATWSRVQHTSACSSGSSFSFRYDCLYFCLPVLDSIACRHRKSGPRRSIPTGAKTALVYKSYLFCLCPLLLSPDRDIFAGVYSWHSKGFCRLFYRGLHIAPRLRISHSTCKSNDVLPQAHRYMQTFAALDLAAFCLEPFLAWQTQTLASL